MQTIFLIYIVIFTRNYKNVADSKQTKTTTTEEVFLSVYFREMRNKVNMENETTY